MRCFGTPPKAGETAAIWEPTALKSDDERQTRHSRFGAERITPNLNGMKLDSVSAALSRLREAARLSLSVPPAPVRVVTLPNPEAHAMLEIDYDEGPEPVIKRREVERKPRWLLYLLGAVIAVLFVYGTFSSCKTTTRRGLERRKRSVDAPIETPPEWIDCVRVVGSKGTPEVAAGAVAELVSLGFKKETIVVHLSQRDPESHKRGCYTAHRAVHAAAVANGCGATLVVEDDVVFSDTIERAWADVDAARGKFDTMWFGYIALRIDPEPTLPPGIVTALQPMLAHAVLFSAEASRRVARLPDWEARAANESIFEAYDVALWDRKVTEQDRTLGVYPPVASQLVSREESLSLDKQPFLDWTKSEAGLALMAAASYERCLFIFRGATASMVATVLSRFIALSPDAISLAAAYKCAEADGKRQVEAAT